MENQGSFRSYPEYTGGKSGLLRRYLECIGALAHIPTRCR